jgi:SAM-dependent methyltransferase
MTSAQRPDRAAGEGTEGSEYTDRLRTLTAPRWKQVLDVQRPYRWNARRLLGDRFVLDVGCGIGRNLEHLSPNAVGVDHNAASIAECRERGLTAYTTDEFFADFEQHRGRYTGLIAAHLVEHMRPEQAVEILQSYSEALAPGARADLPAGEGLRQRRHARELLRPRHLGVGGRAVRMDRREAVLVPVPAPRRQGLPLQRVRAGGPHAPVTPAGT